MGWVVIIFFTLFSLITRHDWKYSNVCYVEVCEDRELCKNKLKWNVMIVKFTFSEFSHNSSASSLWTGDSRRIGRFPIRVAGIIGIWVILDDSAIFADYRTIWWFVVFGLSLGWSVHRWGFLNWRCGEGSLPLCEEIWVWYESPTIVWCVEWARWRTNVRREWWFDGKFWNECCGCSRQDSSGLKRWFYCFRHRRRAESIGNGIW